MEPKVKPRSSRPLAASTYLVRNSSKTLPLAAVIILAVMLIGGIVSMIDSIPLSIKTIYHYSQFSLGVTPRGDADLTPKLKAEFLKKAPVPIERIMVCRASGSQVKSIVGKWPFVVLALTHDDMEYYNRRMKVKGIKGRLPDDGKPEALVSEPVARNLGLSIGSTLLGPDTSESYSPKEVKIVGIADTDEWMMVAPVDYHRANHFPPIDVLLVFAKDRADQQKLDRWAEKEFKGQRAQLFAYEELEKNTDEMFAILYQILNVVIGTLVLVITVMMAMLMNIYQSQRLQEFGLLQALGYTKRALLRKVIRETLVVVVGGWIVGLLVAWSLLNLTKAILMDPRAFALDTTDPIAFLYTVPIPVAISLAAAFTVGMRFKRFDPVSVVERRLV